MLKKLEPLPKKTPIVGTNSNLIKNKSSVLSKASPSVINSSNSLKANINKSSSLRSLKNTKSSTSLTLSKGVPNKNLVSEIKDENTLNGPSPEPNTELNTQDFILNPENSQDPATPVVSTPLLGISQSMTSLTINNTSELDFSSGSQAKLSSSQSTPSLVLPAKKEETIVVRKGAPNWPAMVSKTKNNLTVGAAALWMKNRIKKNEDGMENSQKVEKVEKNAVLPPEEEEDDIPSIKFAKKKTTLVRQCEKCQMLYANFHSC